MAARYDLIKCINAGPEHKVWKLKVHVIRLWTVSHFANSGVKAPIEMIVLDKEGDTIQCSIKGIFVPIFEGLPAEDNVYVVTNFAIALNTIKFKPTRHEFRINFKRNTNVRPVQDSSVLLNGFNFVPFKKIHAKSKEDGYLVGVMGVSNINYNSKLFINIEFLAARNFFTRMNKLDPVDGQSIILLVYDQPVSIEKDSLRLLVYKTIAEIKEHNQNVVFVTAGTIKEVETEFGWWYKGCKKCRRGLRKLEKRYFCPNCVEDYVFYVPRLLQVKEQCVEKLLYIYDTENEIDNRIGTLRSNKAINERNRKIVAILRNMLDKYNSLAKNFRYVRDRYQQENYTNIKFKLISKRTKDSMTYDLPSASEVAALIVGDVEQLSKDRDIIIESQSRSSSGLMEDGFRLGITTLDSISARPTKKNKITLRQFFAFRLQKRTGESPLILRSKRLFQQFLVDAYTMVESEKLKFFRCKQPQLRVDKYKCLHESLIIGDVDAARLGKRIILPSTFTGGPRYAGYPSYFITMTCNPEWDEIKREVTSIGLKAEDRPDILYVCTVGFQKRGLPHAHILLFMSNEFKPQTPDDIDKHITAEIPDKNERPNLHGAVQNYMVHGPCGPYNKNSPCMKNGSLKKRKCVLDNKFIVPYNPELLLKFGCHINVEYTCQTSSIKYLFKYIHKGNDCVTATLYNAGDMSEATQVVDEIRNYYNCRYILACEAVWHLFGYEIQEKEPFVIRLPFHLEDEQPLIYGETSNVNDIVERAISHKSIFLGWMAANMSYPYARSLTYPEFPTKFVWKDDSSK
ncbi:uncharacterized protein LOC110272129 [Arachis ipaensis]|uniref:uncharacterized protein LOC110272129 n=1 Tax=Arachis ipaensis TaxID=130454 RepID=UPI000A2B35BC|nr:uncharacterized protein LOC110272129 [Arachis ipaensis]